MPTPYNLEEEQNTSLQNENDTSPSNINNPLDSLRDIGGIPLPQDRDMVKWITVIMVILTLAVISFVGFWINKEMEFKNQQIKDCNENFQTLNVNYILKDQELQQLKHQTGIIDKDSTESPH